MAYKKTIRIPIKTDLEINIPHFHEIDRTDLVVGIGEIWGRDGTYPRTDLGLWTFMSTHPETFIANIYLEHDGSLSCSAEIDVCTKLEDTIREDAVKIYKKLNDKYKTLFLKYNLKGWDDVIRLNMHREGLKEWLQSHWRPGKIIRREDGGIQNGNVGLYMHTWTSDRKFYTYASYYIDFPKDIFIPNMFAGSQSPQEIAQWGRKIFAPKTYNFSTKNERDIKIKELYDTFANNQLIGFE